MAVRAKLGLLGTGAVTLAGALYGIGSTVTAGPRVLPGVALCVLGLALLTQWSTNGLGPAVDTLRGAILSASIAGWAFIAPAGLESYIVTVAVAVGIAFAGVGESAWLLVRAPSTVGHTKQRSRRWWRLFYLALIPGALGLVVVVVFGLQANGTRDATGSMEIVGWMAAVVLCLPPVVSAGLGRVPRRGLLAGVAAITAPILLVSLLDWGDWLRILCVGAAIALLGWSVASLRSGRPVSDGPATLGYIRTLIGASTIGCMASLAVLSLLLLARTA